MSIQTAGHRHARGLRHRQRDRTQVFGLEVVHVGFTGTARHHRRFRVKRLQQVVAAFLAILLRQIGVKNRLAGGYLKAFK